MPVDAMLSDVALPLWLALIVAAFAVVGLLDRAIVPFVRWLVRRRRERAVARLNTQLKLRIHPFKLASRRALVGQLMLDPEVLKAVDDEAARTGEPRGILVRRARRYAREIVPAFSTTAYFRFGTRAARAVSHTLYDVHLRALDAAALDRIAPDATVVFVINHRSNMDYVLVTYVASQTSALSYAVGEWARVFGLQTLIRAMGGYFIRRDSRNPLYRKVLSRYVHNATMAGVTQAVFPEGGLTRDGALQPPRLGLLAYMVSGFDPGGPRDIAFVPVGINYDRVLEDRVQIAAAATPKGERPRFKFNLFVFLGFVARTLWGRLTGRWQRFGTASVSFGAPVSLRQYLRNRAVDFRTLPEAARFAEIERLGQRLIAEVGSVVPVTSVALVATAVLGAGTQGLTTLELKAAVSELMRRLAKDGAAIDPRRGAEEDAIDRGLAMLTLRHLVEVRDGICRASVNELPLLAYYANSIAHLLGEPPRLMV